MDKKRVNEFGRAYETDENGEEKKEKAGEGETAEDNPPEPEEPKGSEEKKND